MLFLWLLKATRQCLENERRAGITVFAVLTTETIKLRFPIWLHMNGPSLRLMLGKEISQITPQVVSMTTNIQLFLDLTFSFIIAVPNSSKNGYFYERF